jgi:hypothetical protein
MVREAGFAWLRARTAAENPYFSGLWMVPTRLVLATSTSPGQRARTCHWDGLGRRARMPSASISPS